MLKCFDLTEADLLRLNELKSITGAGSHREVVRRAIEEYHEKILTKKYSTEKNNEEINSFSQGK
ncbi:MAG: hypothetical protein IJW08_06055 [Lentisphaeria bacterium]|nr:hypothetical protein [Lentisphaeria bacterium]